jgi:ketosteroid isomerase-like protein
MSTTQNKQLLQHLYAELERGDSRPFVEKLADDFRWVIAGDSCWSRTYEGKQAVLNELFPKLRATLADRVRTRATRFIAEGDLVVVEARGNNNTRTGMPYNNSYCMIYTVRDGMLREMVEYMDTDLAIRALGDPATIPA